MRGSECDDIHWFRAYVVLQRAVFCRAMAGLANKPQDAAAIPDRGQPRSGPRRTRGRSAGANISRRIPDCRIRAIRVRRAGRLHGPERNNGRPIRLPEAGVKDAARPPSNFCSGKKKGTRQICFSSCDGHCIHLFIALPVSTSVAVDTLRGRVARGHTSAPL